MAGELTTRDHDRNASGMTYVYPVVSRRSRGVSVGVNLNPNAACNWRCVYCQVPGLSHGKGPAIDLALLERELDALLGDIVEGDFLERRVPEGSRRLNDVAFSGNGEPTSSPDFERAIEVAVAVLRRREATRGTRLVLITNGSLVDQPGVIAGLHRLAAHGGEVWFKLDAATDAGMEAVNSARTGAARQLERLRRTAAIARTWVQTCLFARAGAPPSEAEVDAYVEALAGLARDGLELAGVQLYGLARPSLQPEAPELERLPDAWMERLAERVRATGLRVELAP